jgi:O-succinylbenzoic acid--CoA ligase
MRPLVAVDASDQPAVADAVRLALRGEGPAILPVAPDAAGPPSAASGVPDLVPARVALVVTTSGTTARPKRVALSSAALLASARASDVALGGAGRWLLALPLTYIAGLNVIVRSIAAGTDPVLLGTGRFEVVRFLAATDRMGPGRRFTSLVPVQLARLVDAAGPDGADPDAADSDGIAPAASTGIAPPPAAAAAPGDPDGVDPEALLDALRRFDRILVGGQATDAGLLARAESLGLRVTRTYGASETGGGCVYDGRPLDGTRVRLRQGEIELAGPTLADGYLGDDERTAQAFPVVGGERWYRTGDTGTLTGGVLDVTGRLDDVIVSGGLKVALGEVERVVRSLAGASEAVVVRAASPRWGEVPVVVAPVALDLDRMRAAVGAELGPAAAPASVVVVERMPLLPNGKPDRIALRALAASAPLR